MSRCQVQCSQHSPSMVTLGCHGHQPLHFHQNSTAFGLPAQAASSSLARTGRAERVSEDLTAKQPTHPVRVCNATPTGCPQGDRCHRSHHIGALFAPSTLLDRSRPRIGQVRAHHRSVMDSTELGCQDLWILTFTLLHWRRSHMCFRVCTAFSSLLES